MNMLTIYERHDPLNDVVTVEDPALGIMTYGETLMGARLVYFSALHLLQQNLSHLSTERQEILSLRIVEHAPEIV